jgi:hypothetical protein
MVAFVVVFLLRNFISHTPRQVIEDATDREREIETKD